VLAATDRGWDVLVDAGTDEETAAGRRALPDRMEHLVRVDDQVQIRLSDDGQSPAFPSRVDAVEADGLVLNWPADHGVPVPVEVEQPLALYFVREDAVYNFRAVAAEIRPGPDARIVVRPAGPVKRIQRREYYRVRAAVPVQLLRVAGASRAPAGTRRCPSHMITHTVDISGAGISVNQGFEVPIGAEFEAKLHLGGGKPVLKLRCLVVHCEALETEERPVYHIALSFDGIREAERRALVRHVFDLQRASIHKRP
jgi:c-di-GMP-binding flagellar brake protein YcgR